MWSCISSPETLPVTIRVTGWALPVSGDFHGDRVSIQFALRDRARLAVVAKHGTADCAVVQFEIEDGLAPRLHWPVPFSCDVSGKHGSWEQKRAEENWCESRSTHSCSIQIEI